MRTKTLAIAVAAACITALGVPSAHATRDPLWSEQYGPAQIGGPAAWTKAIGSGVTVAIVDSGVDIDHPDLKDKIDRATSYDFGCGDSNPDDDSTIKDSEGKLVKGHGTHVAGTAAAITDNGVGVAGMAPAAKIMALKVFPSNDTCNPGLLGAGGFTAVPDAIAHAVDKGAKVINLSLGTFSFGGGIVGFIETPCRQAFSRGSLCVVASGNSGDTKSSGYPKDLPVLNVTANDSTGKHALFGQKADTMWGVSAPGVAVLNTWPVDDPNHQGYNSIQGTSMAAPHAAGAAAVLFSMGLNARQVAETLVRTAGPPRDSSVEGAGIIHLDKAAGVNTAGAPAGTPAAGGTGPGAVTRRPGATAGNGPAQGGTARGPAVTVPGESGEFLPQEGTAFEEGLNENGSDDSIENILLKTPRKTSANKPFNAVIPIGIISLVALAAGAFVGIPRLRARDTPSL
ncbi:MAG TPA: S8 family serine peptidase [Acidimicrobiales bacterium]|nr:S8 family serine peptidase [Acidimicrobiales bacterium]